MIKIKNQSEMKKTIEMNDTLEGINRLAEAEYQISNLEDNKAENTQLEQQTKKKRIFINPL